MITPAPSQLAQSSSKAAVQRARRFRRHANIAIEQLESRTLLTLVLTSAFNNVSVSHDASPTTVSLSNHFDNPAITGTVVQFNVATTRGGPTGSVNIELTDIATPLTVANFLHYVNTGLYNGTFFHRVQLLANNGIGIVQGGGYSLTLNAQNQIQHIGTFPPIQNEFSATRPNVGGTIAMAKTSDPNSATSEWYFNTTDNPALDDTNNSGGFTTFGHILSGTNIINSIDTSPQVNVGGPFTNLPVAPGTNPQSIFLSDLVALNTASVVNKIVGFGAQSSNTNLVTVSGSGSNLTLTYAAGASGTSTITVTAIDAAGNSLNTTFNVTVTAPTISVSDGQTPLANNQAAPVNFGSANVSSSLQHTLTVKNNGNQTLNVGTVTPPSGFSIIKNLATSLAPNASDTLVLAASTTSPGTESGNLSIASDDPAATSFSIPLFADVVTSQFTASSLAVYSFGGTQASPTLTVSSGTLTFLSDIAPAYPNLAITVNTGATVALNAAEHLASLNLTGGTASIASAGSNTLVLKSLTINTPAGGRLDVSDNSVIINYTGTSPLSDMRTYIQSGRNAPAAAPAPWNGAGINSSFANTNGNGFNLAIGFADNATLASINAAGSYTSFGGQSAASNAVLIRMTRGADANLDSHVDGSDVSIIGTHFNQPGSGQWFFGDFDYSGQCDGNDISILGTTFGATTPTLAPAILAPASLAITTSTATASQEIVPAIEPAAPPPSSNDDNNNTPIITSVVPASAAKRAGNPPPFSSLPISTPPTKSSHKRKPHTPLTADILLPGSLSSPF